MANTHPKSKEQSYADFNLVPLPANAIPLGSAFIPNSVPTRPNSLSRLDELHKFLGQCEAPAYYNNYHQLLTSATPGMLQDALKSLKERATWLDDQQEIEFTRMRSLNILPQSVTKSLTGSMKSNPPAPNTSEPAHKTGQLDASKLNNGSATPEVAAVPLSAGTDLPAALEHHKLVRDSVTPPNQLQTEAKATRGRKKGPATKGQAQLKRKRT